MGIIFLLGIALTLSAQQPLHYNINTDHGLPSNEVFEIDQDSFGHVWIGCNTGLYRYDGVRFKRYSSRFETSRAMTMMRIDRQSRVWCGNVSGQYFVQDGDSLRLIFNHDASARYEHVTVGSDGDLLVIRPGRIMRIGWDGRESRRWKEDWPWETSGFVSDFCWRGDEAFMLLSTGGAMRYRLSTSRLDSIQLPANFQSAGAGGFAIKGDAAVYAKYLRPVEGGTALLELEGNRFREIYAEQVPVEGWLRIMPIAPERVWICTQSGAKELRKVGDAWQVGETMIPEAQVSAVMADHEGNMWFSSINKGLFLVPSAGVKRFGKPGDPLWDANVTALCTMQDGAVLVGNSQGQVYAIDTQSDEARLVLDISPKARAVKRIRRVGCLLISCVRKTPSWIGLEAGIGPITMEVPGTVSWMETPCGLLVRRWG
ncbi:MAG: hypothetical protein U0176_00340 [Bacteroidia bacterium]